MVRRFPSGDVGFSEVDLGSGMSMGGIIGGAAVHCCSGDESGGGAPDSRGFSRNSGEGGSNVLLTRGKKTLTLHTSS